MKERNLACPTRRDCTLQFMNLDTQSHVTSVKEQINFTRLPLLLEVEVLEL